MKSKKGFELSVNMIVVMVLGITILGIGISIFYNAFNKTIEMRENVDSQNQRQLEALLDDGSPVVLPFSSKEGERGSYVDFNVGINNELLDEFDFKVNVEYSYSTANPDLAVIFENERDCDSQCGPLYNENPFTLQHNEHKYFPIRIIIPKKGVPSGQYFFNVDVVYDDDEGTETPYGSKQVISILVK